MVLMAEGELVYEGEIVDEDAGWYEEAVAAYQQADEHVTDAKWMRCKVAFVVMHRATETGDRTLMRQFAGDVRRTASHLRDEAFAHGFKTALQSTGQPVPLTLSPSFYVEASKGRRAEIEAGNPDAMRQAGELLAQAEDEHWTTASLREAATNHRALGTGENEWYTPPDVLEDVRHVLGEIDLDPASSEKAQILVGAKRFFSIEQNALEREWGGKVFLNPPYSQPAIEQFARKMVSEYEVGRVREAVMLTHNYTDTRWFHIAESRAAAICFTRGRIKFVSPDGELAAPTQGQAFFYYGKRPDTFREVFRGRGFIR